MERATSAAPSRYASRVLQIPSELREREREREKEGEREESRDENVAVHDLAANGYSYMSRSRVIMPPSPRPRPFKSTPTRLSLRNETPRGHASSHVTLVASRAPMKSDPGEWR
jgi:hypothetical protein